MRIMLASHSVAYAPLYWAKAINIGDMGDHTFHYPSRSSFKKNEPDPVVSSLFREKGERSDLVVCDPCRMVFSSEAHFDELVIVGTFIRRPMFSIATKGDKDNIDFLVSPPWGMTGYMVAAQYLKTRFPDASPEFISDRILDFGGGSWEKERYDTVVGGVFRRGKKESYNQLGFVTPDIRVRASLGAYADYKVVNWQGDGQESEGDELQGMDNGQALVGSMTCFVTTKEKLKDFKPDIISFLKTMCASVAEVREGASYRAAFDLLYDIEARRILYPKRTALSVKRRGPQDEKIRITKQMLEVLTAKSSVAHERGKFHYYCDRIYAGKVGLNWSETSVQDILATQGRLSNFNNIFSDDLGVYSANIIKYLDNDVLKDKIRSL